MPLTHAVPFEVLKAQAGVYKNELRRARLHGLIAELSPGTQFLKRYMGPDRPFQMMWINREYERVWEVSRDKYEEATDHDVWDDQVANAFMKNDHHAYTHGKCWFIEDAGGRECLVLKYPVLSEDYEFRGVAGLAIPLAEISGLLHEHIRRPFLRHDDGGDRKTPADGPVATGKD